MPIDYRSELKRPVSLVLAGVAVLALLLSVGIWLSFSNRLEASRAETARVQQAEGTLRGVLGEQQRTGGNLADLQTRVTEAQRRLAEVNQAREQAETWVCPV